MSLLLDLADEAATEALGRRLAVKLAVAADGDARHAELAGEGWTGRFGALAP